MTDVSKIIAEAKLSVAAETTRERDQKRAHDAAQSYKPPVGQRVLEIRALTQRFAAAAPPSGMNRYYRYEGLARRSLKQALTGAKHTRVPAGSALITGWSLKCTSDTASYLVITPKANLYAVGSGWQFTERDFKLNAVRVTMGPFGKVLHEEFWHVSDLDKEDEFVWKHLAPDSYRRAQEEARRWSSNEFMTYAGNPNWQGSTVHVPSDFAPDLVVAAYAAALTRKLGELGAGWS